MNQNYSFVVTQLNYSVSDIVGLLNKRGKELYFAAENKIVRVRYSSFTQSIIIEIVNDPIAGGELRELSAEDRLRAKLTGDSTSDLYFRCSGNQYGDNDSRDEYSPLNEVPRVGSGIELEGRTQFSRYLQHIGNLLNK